MQKKKIIFIFSALCLLFLFSCKNKAIVKDFAEKVLKNPENIMAICESSEIDCSIFINNYIKTGEYYRGLTPEYIKLYMQGDNDVVINRTSRLYDSEKNESYNLHRIIVKNADGVESVEFQFRYDEIKDKLYLTSISWGPYGTSDIIWEE